MTESLLLAALAGGCGILVAVWTNGLITSFQPPLPIPIAITVGIDPAVLAFTTIAAIAAGVLFGMAPAVQATKPDLVPALKGESSQRTAGRSWLRNALVVAQMAMSLALLIGAGLFLRSLDNAQSIDPGFATDNMLVASLDPSQQGYDEAQTDQFYRELVERVEALPGVRSAAIGDRVPLVLGGGQQWGFSVDGYEFSSNERDNVDYKVVGPGYFRTMGIPLVAGREFGAQDTGDSQPVIIVNETFARHYFSGREPIGGIVDTMRGERAVIGIAHDSKYYTLGEEPLPYVFGPDQQVTMSQMSLHVRTDRDSLAVLPAVRAEVRAIDADLPLFDISTMEEAMGTSLLLQRLMTGVLGTFGSLALVLAAVGLYGVMAFTVSQRTREIGIRIALGAGGRDVRAMVLRQAMILSGVGVAIGLLVGLGLGFVVASSGALYDVSALDPVALGGGVGTIVAVALLASYIPALRATRIDPMVALRYE